MAEMGWDRRPKEKNAKRGNVNIKSIISRECEYILCVWKREATICSTMRTEQEMQTVAIVIHVHVVVVATVHS